MTTLPSSTIHFDISVQVPSSYKGFLSHSSLKSSEWRQLGPDFSFPLPFPKGSCHAFFKVLANVTHLAFVDTVVEKHNVPMKISGERNSTTAS